MDIEDDDSIDSILTEIETSLRSSYPSTGESENQVFSAYHDDLRTVGYGRRDVDYSVTYNNPFDPRLTFPGLGEHIYHPDVKDEKRKAELIQNVFLALDKPSQFMDKYLNGYRAYVRGLCASPGSGDWWNNDGECKRLYERISSDSVKSLWSETDDNKTVNEHVKDQMDGTNIQQTKTKTSLNRHTLRQKTNSNSLAKEEKPLVKAEGPERYLDCVTTKDVQQSSSLTKSSWPSLGTHDTRGPTLKDNKNLKEHSDSWAGLFKKENRHSNPESESTSEDEETKKNESVEHEPEKRHEHLSIFPTHQDISIQPCKKNYANPIYTRSTKPLLPNPQRQLGNQVTTQQTQGVEQRQHIQSQGYANNQTRQLWTDQNPNQSHQHQLWSGHTDYQQPLSYQHQQTNLPPPPGFNQILPRPSQVSCQRPYYQPEQSGMYHNTQQQDLCDQQSLVCNVQRYVQQPTAPSTASKCQYYQGPQFTYQGNWNANNNWEMNAEEDIYSNETVSSSVHFSKHCLDMSEEHHTVKEYKDKPRFKSRQIRTNLIRIYPSKDNN